MLNKKECPEQDSNLHASRHTHLKRARLPIPPPGHLNIRSITAMPLFCSKCGAENGTRTRDPNLGKVVLYQLSYFRVFCEDSTFLVASQHKKKHFLLYSTRSKIPLSSRHSSECGCKGNAFFGTDKLFGRFFSKKVPFYRK